MYIYILRRQEPCHCSPWTSSELQPSEASLDPAPVGEAPPTAAGGLYLRRKPSSLQDVCPGGGQKGKGTILKS